MERADGLHDETVIVVETVRYVRQTFTTSKEHPQ
jgi:hypothetical protein